MPRPQNPFPLPLPLPPGNFGPEIPPELNDQGFQNIAANDLAIGLQNAIFRNEDHYNNVLRVQHPQHNITYTFERNIRTGFIHYERNLIPNGLVFNLDPWIPIIDPADEALVRKLNEDIIGESRVKKYKAINTTKDSKAHIKIYPEAIYKLCEPTICKKYFYRVYSKVYLKKYYKMFGKRYYPIEPLFQCFVMRNSFKALQFNFAFPNKHLKHHAVRNFLFGDDYLYKITQETKFCWNNNENIFGERNLSIMRDNLITKLEPHLIKNHNFDTHRLNSMG